MTKRERQAREKRARAVLRRIDRIQEARLHRRVQAAARAAFERYVASGQPLPEGASDELRARYEQVKRGLGRGADR